MNAIWDSLINLFMTGVKLCLDGFIFAFNASLTVLETEVGKTPVQFSASLVTTIREISDDVVVPVAGLILTYILCKELIDLFNDHNSMKDTTTFDLFKIILRITLAILLVNNTFDIVLAFFDVGQYMVDGVSATNSIISINTDTIVGMLNPASNPLTGASGVGSALIYAIFCLVAMVVGFVAVGLIYVIAWTRIVMILIYISVAPIPLVTFFNKDWVGGIGQNYIKNLMAFAIQGFLMFICLVVYSHIVGNMNQFMAGQSGLMIIVMLLVMIFICVSSLMKCLTLAKSIMQAQ